jgi:bifunctional aspartokinase / homoserine dehydrogenase 1
MTPFVVHKFGGSSVADEACMRRAAAIIEADTHPRVAVVVSALQGVTDALLRLLHGAEQRDSHNAALQSLRDRHAAMATALLDDAERERFVARLDTDCRDIDGILQTVRLIRAASPALRDLLVGFGELWSSDLFCALLKARRRRDGVFQWVDSRTVVEVENGVLGPTVRWEQSTERIKRHLSDTERVTLVAPGFIASDQHGLQTTLGRNGSDFSASIFAALLDAGEIIIWTDVDGVLSADPRLVPEATVIPALSYHEAMELAYFGAKVLHPQTMVPAVARGIPIWIRNTFRPDQVGTLICNRPAPTQIVKGITTIDRIALVNVEGAGMIGVPGTAQRLFGTLREHGISVILISQASSEHSICFAVPVGQAAATERAVREAFARELDEGQLQSVDVAPDCSILAVVGDGMAGTHGIAASMFSALASAGANVRAIAQGASERNISVVIDSDQTARALRSVHSGFYLSPHTVSIGLIGPGLVGTTLLDQVASQTTRLQADLRLDLRLRAVMNSRTMILSDQPLDFRHWRERMSTGEPADVARFESHVHAEHLPHAVIVDCTASDEIAQQYPRWLAQGIHIVTPNKKANSAAAAFYRQLQQAQRDGGSHYLYEATVGAGLPVVQTLRDLRDTGDDVKRIEGILSGTLSYLFNIWDGQRPFSSVLRDARQLGFTEPDPRDDLSGADVGRKLIILAREIGVPLELGELALENLVPDTLRGCSTDEFLARAEELDEPMSARLETAAANGRVLRYVGALDAALGRATVGLVEVERTDPLANIQLTDNIVRYTTTRYDRNPLVIQGPGAGPAVTAAAVFADLLRMCAYLGARR